MPPPTRLDDDMINHKMSSHHEEEVERLKKRNNRLEEDVRLLNDQLLGKAGVQPMTLAQDGSTFNVGGQRLGAVPKSLDERRTS